MRAPASALDMELLARELPAREREAVRAGLVGLLRFHRTLAGFPRVRGPRATPIVALYEAGALRGCAVWRGGGTGGERIARAFFGAACALAPSTLAARAPSPPGALAAQAFFARTVRWLRDPADLDAGTEGIALVRRGVPPVLLMPQVARDHGVDARGMLALLLDKAGLPGLPREARLAAWTVDTVVARSVDAGPRSVDAGGARTGDVEAASARAAARSGAGATDYAAAWLARMIDGTGRVAFAIDPRSRTLQPSGALWHARSAIAIEALAAHGGYAQAVRRAQRWLGGELARALRGVRVEAWPDDRASVLGTLALACLAGIRARDRLRELATGWRALVRSPAWPWHAGQVACALGRDTPKDLWAWCIEDLARHPFAPYTALAARAAGDEAAYRRAADAVATFVRREPPHRGGATATELPETALTAVAAHALAGSRRHRPTHADALAFVGARQLLPGRIAAPLDPTLALGGFAATPVDDVLRADIAGHALLALVATS